MLLKLTPLKLTPAEQAPKTDAPKADASKADAPKTDAPAAQPEAKPAEQAPKTDAPKADAPKTDAPKTDAPAAQPEAKPAEQAPKADAAKTDAAKQEPAPAKTEAKPADAANVTAKPAIEVTKKEVIDKIDKIQKASQEEVDRIIGENTRDGHIDLDKMRDIAGSFCADAAGRGDKRYHQAANILEQSYARESLKQEGNVKTGLSYFYDILINDRKIFSIYKKMPVEEAAVRLNNLRNNELANCKVVDGMTPDKFFNDVMAKIVENSKKQ